MRFFKKAAAAAVAVFMSLSAVSAGALAQSEPGANRIYFEAEKASVGETVPVTVMVDTTRGVGGLTFTIKYSTNELRLVEGSVQVQQVVPGWLASTNDATDGEILYSGARTGDDGFSSQKTAILIMDFEVLRSNATLTIDDADLSINANDFDGTDDTAAYANNGTTIECSHKTTETKTTPSTCTVKGKEETVCKDCGEAVGETKELPLKEHTWNSGTETTKPTCTADGVMTYTCTVCGTATKTEPIKAAGHKWDEGNITKPAACTENGEKTFTCTVCGETKKETVEAAGHKFGEGVVTKEPSCNDDGEEKVICEVCGAEETKAIPAAGHSFGDWTVVKEATETETGVEERVCGTCGEIETRDIPVKSPSVPSTTENNPGTVTPAPESSAATSAPAPESSAATSAPAPESSAATAAPAPESSVGTSAPVSDNGAAATAAETEKNTDAAGDNNVNTGIVGISAVAGLTAIAAAAVIIAKKRK